MIGQEVLPTERTTPESFELQRLFARMREEGCTHVVMEVSSHALALDRVYGVHYAVGIFTNLTQDHLGFHKTMEAYCDAKALLFSNCDTGVCNADDPWTERLLRQAEPFMGIGELCFAAGRLAIPAEKFLVSDAVIGALFEADD